ncbi:hypothetical protein NKG05_02050 [Oerskovia sp. M15]
MAHKKVQRRLIEMIDILDVADQIVAKGEGRSSARPTGSTSSRPPRS